MGTMGKIRLVISLILLGLLLAGCGETTLSPTSNPASLATPAPTKRTSVSKDELAYPGAEWLSDKEVFPEGLPEWFQTGLFGAFVTNDSQAQVLDFYQKRLVSMGLGYEPGYGCLQPGTCQKIYQLDADFTECIPAKNYCGSTYQFSFMLLDRDASPKDDTNHTIPQNFYDLAKSGQTLVMFGGGTYHPLTTPPANPTTAGVPDNKITPSVDK